jgi:putative hydrolase of the HAD superfamily
MKTIVFDFGNVIGFFDHRLTLSRLTPFTDMSADDMYAAVYQGPLEDAFESGQLGAADFLRQVRELCRLRCDVAYMATAFADIFQPNEAVCALIPLLKPRYRVLLGSNTNQLHAGHFREQFADTLGHFDHLILSYEIGVRKPRAAFFEHCQRLADCEPGECLFIDDLQSNIEGARTFGWHGLQYVPSMDLRSALLL